MLLVVLLRLTLAVAVLLRLREWSQLLELVLQLGLPVQLLSQPVLLKVLVSESRMPRRELVQPAEPRSERYA